VSIWVGFAALATACVLAFLFAAFISRQGRGGNRTGAPRFSAQPQQLSNENVLENLYFAQTAPDFGPPPPTATLEPISETYEP